MAFEEFTGELDGPTGAAAFVPFEGKLDEAPAKPKADAVEYDFGDASGAGDGAAIMAVAKPKRESVLEGMKLPEVPFNPEEAARMSRRAYAESKLPPEDPRNFAPSMREGRAAAPDANVARGATLRDSSMPVRAAAKALAGGVQGVGGVVRAAGDLVGVDEISNFGKAAASGAANFEAGMGESGPVEGFGPKSPVPYLKDMAEGAGSSLAQSAALATMFGPAGVIPAMSIMISGQGYQQARQQGLDPAMALAGAVPKGIFEAVGEKFTGLDKVAGAMGVLLQKGASDTAKRTAGEILVRAGIKEIPGEVLTYLGQTGTDLIPGIGLQQDMTMQDFVNGLRDTVVQSAMMGGAFAGGGHAAQHKTAKPIPTAEILMREKWGAAPTAPVKLDPVVEIGKATTVDEAITAAKASVQSTSAVDAIGDILAAQGLTQGSSPTQQAQAAIADIEATPTEAPDVSLPTELRDVDTGAAGSGFTEFTGSLDVGLGAGSIDGPAVDPGRAGDQPGGDSVPLANGGQAGAVAPVDIAQAATNSIANVQDKTQGTEPGTEAPAAPGQAPAAVGSNAATAQGLPGAGSATVESAGVKPVDQRLIPVSKRKASPAATVITGKKLDGDWREFSTGSGTLNIPRAEMPQIKSEHRGAMVNFLNARDIAHTQEEVPAESLKPTQTEFSPEKVEKALGFTGTDRSILVSSDNHVLDGHHQWMAKLNAGEPVKVIRLDAPIKQLLDVVREFPSAEVAPGAVANSAAPVADKAPSVSEKPVSETQTATTVSQSQGKQVSSYTGKFGKGMGKDAARLEAQRLNRTADGIIYTAEEHNDPKLENQWAVVGREVSKPNQAPARTEYAQAATENVAPAKTKKPQGGKTLRAAAYDKNPLMTFLATHGLFHDKAKPNSHKSEFSPDKGIMVMGYGPVFKKTGKRLDELTHNAIEEGYLPKDGTEDQLRELIRRAVAGEKIAPLYAEGVAEQVAEQSFAEHLAQQQEAAQDEDFDPLAPLTELEITGADIAQSDYDSLSPELQLEVNALIAYTEDRGIDVDLIKEEAANETHGQPQDAYLQTAKRALTEAIEKGDRGSSADSGSQGNAPEQGRAGQEDGLTAPTREDVLAQQDRAAAATKAEAKNATDAANKAKADAERNEFTLTGSDRPADVGAAGGQQDIFGGVSEKELAPVRQSIEDMRRKLVDIENRIVGAAGLAPDFIEEAMKSRKVPADLKQQRNDLREQMREERKRIESAQREASNSADPIAETKATLDANNVTGKERLDVLKDVKAGTLTAEEVKEAYPNKILDFGEKIGGAKKDTWTGFKDDLSAVADDEIASRKLSEIWPAPDYQKLIDGGMDAKSVAVIRALRDEIPAKPRNAYKLKRWADQVQTMRALAANIMDGKDTGSSIAGFLERGTGPSKGIAGRADLYMAVGHDKSLEGIRLAHHHYSLYRGRENVSLWVAERDSGATAFSNWPQELATGDTKEDAIAAFKARYAELDSIAAVKKASFDIITESGKKGFFIGKKIGRNIATLAGPFDTLKEARDYRANNLDALDAKLAKYKEIPNERRDTNEPRVGEDMRNGQDVTPEMFAQSFGFKGVEFGNWVEQKRRQKDLNDAFDALMDMAAIMGVPAKSISLNGELGLAFGARGSGGVNPAAAHYESGKVVINLTKREGAGSLGHEWWHALDNYFSRMRGSKTSPYMTTATDVGLSARGANYMPYEGVRKEMIDAFGEVVRAIKQTAIKARSSKIDTKRTKEYWGAGEEMAARAFESYLISKLQDQNASNDYLANIVDEKTWDAMAAMGMENEDSYPYPTAGEMPVIRAGFDKFFQTLETKETDKGVAMFARGTNKAVTNPKDVVGNTQGGRSADDTTPGVSEFQQRVIAAQDMADEVKSTGQRLTIRSDGTVSLFHSTSESNANAIRAGGTFKGNTWFSASKAATIEHAKPKHGKSTTTIEVAVDPRHIEFSTGTGEFYAPDGLTRNDAGVWVKPNESTAPDSGGASSRGKDQTQTEAFKKWFGDSKVVDADGKPLVVYHGTRRPFNEFTPSKPRGAPGNPEGIYFTADKSAAEEYAQDVDGAWDEKSRVVAAYIKIENDSDGQIIDSAYRGREYVVFKPENIKSATGNNGNFDPANPDIRYALGADAFNFKLQPRQGMSTVESLQAAVADLIGGKQLPNKLGRVVAATSGDIKATWEPLIGKQGLLQAEDPMGDALAFYDPTTKTVFLMADRIPAGDETAILVHELMHKHGQAALGKAGWDRLHGVIGTWAEAAPGSEERRVYDYAADKVEAAGQELSNQELFPYAVEGALKMGIKPSMAAKRGTVANWLESVRQHLKMVWDKITAKPGDFKAQDLVNLAFGIAQMENPESRAQIEGFASEADAAPRGMVAPVSRSPAKTPLYEAMRQLSRFEDAFQTNTSTSKDLADIAADMATKDGYERLPFKVESGTELHQGNRKPTLSLRVTLPNGNEVKLLDIFDADKDRPFVVIGNSEAGQDVGGATAYQIAFAWAHNNGKTMRPDPAGLTVINRLRRTEAMISSAMHYGTTKHLEPHQDQYVALLDRMRDGGKEPEDTHYSSRPDIHGELEALKDKLWTKGDGATTIATNVQHLLEASTQLAYAREPAIRNFEVEGGELRVRDGREGALSLANLDVAGTAGSAKILGVVLRPATTGVGASTLRRAAVSGSVARAAQQARGTESVVSQDGGNQRPDVAALQAIRQVLGRPDLSASGGLRGVFYSRGPADSVEQPTPKKSAWLDATNRAQFAPGAWLYDQIGKAAGPMLVKLGLKAASPELRRQLRQMKIDVEKAQETALAIARETSKLSDAERTMVSDLVEQELKVGVIPPEHAVRLAAMINDAMGRQTDELVNLGMLTKDSADKWRGKYLPRYYASKLQDKLGDAWADALRRLNGRQSVMKGIKGKNLKGRGLYETIPEDQLKNYEALGWEVRDPDYNPSLPTVDGTVQVWRDFTPAEREKMGEIRDAGFRFVMGYMQTQRDIALGRMFERMATDPGQSSRLEKEGYVQVPATVVKGTGAKVYGKLAGRWVPTETMSQLSNIEESTSEAWQMYRKAMAIWKEGKTALNPVSHVNNMVSNLTMAHLAGVSYHRGDKYIAAARDFVKKSPMMQEAKENGLFLGTLSDSELMNSLPDELKLLAQKQESRGEKIGRTGFNIMTMFLRKPMGAAYQSEDTFFRYLIYKDAREHGMEPQDAVDYAQKYIFTYDDLPKGARRIRDFGLPFFSYTYKAIPALLHTALTHPLRIAGPAAVLWAVNAAAYAIAAGDDDDSWEESLQKYLTDPDYREKVREKEKLEREHLPPWMKGTTALMTPKTLRLGMDEVTKLPLFIDISRIIPGGDLFDVSPNAGGIPLPQPITPSHPLFTTLVAMIGNKDLFTGKDLVDSNDTRGEAAAKRASWLWKQLTPAITAGNYHWERGMNALAQANGGEITWLPDVLGGDATGIGRDGNPVQGKYAAMQTFGIKVRPIDLDTAEAIDGSMKKKMIRDIDTELNKLKRLASKGAISDRTLEKERDLAQEKKNRLREGLTVDGDAKD